MNKEHPKDVTEKVLNFMSVLCYIFIKKDIK